MYADERPTDGAFQFTDHRVQHESPTLIRSFHVISVKIAIISFFVERDRIILKITWKTKKNQLKYFEKKNYGIGRASST